MKKLLCYVSAEKKFPVFSICTLFADDATTLSAKMLLSSQLWQQQRLGHF